MGLRDKRAEVIMCKVVKGDYTLQLLLLRRENVSSSERDLLNQASRGEKDALVELLRTHGPAVHRRIAGRIPRRWRSLVSADDVMQQTYADAFLAMDRLPTDVVDSFVAWLTSLADYNLIDALRMLEADKRGKGCRRIENDSGRESFVELYELLDSGRTTPSRHVARDEACAALERAIQQLPETYRRVVRMYDIECTSVEDVALAMQRSPGAVYMIRTRAHRLLHEMMGSVSKYFSKA